MYGFEYATANDIGSLENSLTKVFEQNEKPCILEVFTPTVDNDRVLLRYFKELV
jgi:2-succinyl-5-enolpyruvyl-6-hydroxy-3-cyclohexene-1-carboxylate synthase